MGHRRGRWRSGPASRCCAAPYGPGAGARERLRELRSLYEREQISLLHVHSPVAGGQAVPAVAARLAGVTGTLATYHQIQPVRLGRKSRLANQVTHRRLVDSVMAVSHGVELSLRTNAGVGGPMKVVHNGIDDAGADVMPGDLPARDEGDVWVGYFGRLSPEKGVARLLEMVSMLAPAHPRAAAARRRRRA